MRKEVLLGLSYAAVIAIVTLLVLHPNLPEPVIGALTGILGFFARDISSAFQYEYGTTRGSEEKTLLLAQAQPIDTKGVK